MVDNEKSKAILKLILLGYAARNAIYEVDMIASFQNRISLRKLMNENHLASLNKIIRLETVEI